MSILDRRKAKASTMVLAAPIAALGAVGFTGATAHANPIAPGDILFVQSGDANNPDGNGGTPFYVDEVNPASPGTLVQQFPITQLTGNNTAANSTTLFLNSNGSNGMLALSNNNTLVTFGAYQGNSANELQQNPRQGAGLDAGGNLVLGPTYTENGANGQVRSAYTADGTNYVFGDKNGIFTNGASTPTPSGNFRYVSGYGGTVFASAQSANATASFFTWNGTAVTPINVGSTSWNGETDFAFVQSGLNGNAYDTLYVANGGDILKYYYTGGTLTLDGTAAVSVPGTGALNALTAVEAGNNTVDIFFTTKNGSGMGTVQEVVDSSAGNAAPNFGTFTTLYTLPTASADLFGIAPAPVAVPEPATMSLIGLAGLGLLKRRRARAK